MIKENWMISDLHMHSRFSRACSKQINFENLVKWAKIKGLNLLGTSDFTHPVWLEEIKRDLKDNGKGFFYYGDFPFVLSGEISLIYTQEHGRRVHLILLAPSLEVVDNINSYLDSKGRRDYDGRPIFKISCEEFVSEMMKISEDIEVIPAHIWTPYFGILGSKGGYDSLAEAFGKEIDNVHAIETGISSDPPMNWRIKCLDGKSVLSFSDSHSFWPWRMGRESTIFEKCDSYSELIKQIRENSFVGTIETDPAYGKYHWDGHAKCGFSCGPDKTKELNGLCPKCGKGLVVGVEYRVEELAEKEREEGFKLENGKMFFRLLPLHELISSHIGMGMNSKTVWGVYNNILKEFKTEFKVLLDVSKEELLEKDVNPRLVELIMRNRGGKIKVKPGYDSQYGIPLINGQEKQIKLF